MSLLISDNHLQLQAIKDVFT